MSVSSRTITQVFVAASAAMGVAAALVGGPKGLSGLALGLVGTSASLWGTWMGIQFVGKLMADRSSGWQGAVVPVTAMVIKLPVILGTMVWAQRIGPPAPSWFLAGLALVYSATVWWAVSRH